MISVAQAVVQSLQKEGVSVVFGYPGATICPLYNSLADAPIHHVLVRHEQNAGHAASGYARISGKVGVAIATSGPGAVNLLCALATAYMDSIPLVAITGQVDSALIGRDVFQEADITGAAEPFTKYSYLVKEPEQIARVMKEAFYIARSGRPGPVLIDLPVDVLQTLVDFQYPETISIRGYKPTYAGNPPQVQRVAEAIAQAKRPLICIGGGVLSAQAGEATVALAEQCAVPIVSTMMGLSAVPTEHPLYFGMLGTFGMPTANWAVNQADLLVIIGARVGDRALQSPAVLEKRTRIVHMDVDPAEIGKNVGAAIPLVGDAKNIVTQLLACTHRLPSQPWLEQLRKKQEEAHTMDDRVPRLGFVNPKALVHTLSGMLEEHAVVTADVGQNQIWTARHLILRKGRLLTSGGMGTMGYSLPAAIGAKLADPGRQTVVLCGDGSLQMQMAELATVMQEKLDIKMIVFSNHVLGMVRQLQKERYDGNLCGISLAGGPDFIQLALAYGIPGRRIASHEEMHGALRAMLDSPGPYLLECVVDPEESCP